MTIGEYTERFYGKQVKEFRSGDNIAGDGVVYRLMQEYESEQSSSEFLKEFLSKVDANKLEALVIGSWVEAASGESAAEILEVLVERQLPQLRALFVGDMVCEDSEVSWINQADYGPLLRAYPNLKVLRIRGTEALVIPKFEHAHLAELVIESGGLPSQIVQAIAGSKLPALKKLELWLGDDGYGFDGDVATYADLLQKIKPERLEYLGLRNASIADEIAMYVSTQPWVASLHTLDLSMGTLSDEGAQALLASPYVPQLKVLNLCHHYISPKLVAKLKALPVTLLIDEAEEGDEDDRYVQVSE